MSADNPYDLSKNVNFMLTLNYGRSLLILCDWFMRYNQD